MVLLSGRSRRYLLCVDWCVPLSCKQLLVYSCIDSSHIPWWVCRICCKIKSTRTEFGVLSFSHCWAIFDRSIFEIPKRHRTVARILQTGESCWNVHNVKDGLCKIPIAILTFSPNSVLGWLFKRLFGVTQMKLRLNMGSLWRSTVRLARLLFFWKYG